MRTVTDGGAIRKKRRKFNIWITRLDVARDVARAKTGETADAARRVLRDALGAATELSIHRPNEHQGQARRRQRQRLPSGRLVQVQVRHFLTVPHHYRPPGIIGLIHTHFCEVRTPPVRNVHKCALKSQLRAQYVQGILATPRPPVGAVWGGLSLCEPATLRETAKPKQNGRKRQPLVVAPNLETGSPTA